MTTSTSGGGLLSAPLERKSLKEQEYLSIRHALPKTRINHTILHENPSQERHLTMTLGRVKYRENQVANTFEQTKRNFAEGQMRKQRKWKKEDEMRRSSMNLPMARRVMESNRPSSMVLLYTSPIYYDKDDGQEIRKGAMLPYMALRRERTEILQHRSKTFMTKLPAVIEIHDAKLRRYNTFCGTAQSLLGAPLKDTRFSGLKDLLSPRVPSPAKPVVSQDQESDGFSYYCSSRASTVQRRMSAVSGHQSTKLQLPSLSRGKSMPVLSQAATSTMN